MIIEPSFAAAAPVVGGAAPTSIAASPAAGVAGSGGRSGRGSAARGRAARTVLSALATFAPATLAVATAAGLALAGLVVPAAAQTAVSGAGSTGAFPALEAWITAFAEKTGIAVDYRPLGAVAGIGQLDDGTVTFALVDGPLDQARVDGQSYVQFPLVVDAVVPVANLPGRQDPVVLDAAGLAGLLTGGIARWSDPRLAAVNPGASLPDLAVAPVVRSDPAGETVVVAGFLAAADPAFAAAFGTGAAIAWPGGQAVRGGTEVARAVAAMPGAIGYVAAADLAGSGLVPVRLKTADGSVAAFSPAALAITAEGAAMANPDPTGFAAGLAARRSGGDWPLAFPVVAVMNQVPEDPEASVAALKFFAAVLADDAGVEAAGLAPLPETVSAAVEAAWAARFRSADKPIWPPKAP